MRFWISLGVLVCAVAARAETAPNAKPQIIDMVVTRQSKFTIPFEIFSAQDPANDAIEVILYVSADQGANWRLEGRLAPPKPDAENKRKGGFAFRAPYDGEYWFVVRTVDRQNRLHPDNNTKPTPELRVMVDTVPPRLDVNAVRGANGEVRVKYQAVDPNLKPESLHIEFQAGLGPWRSVAIDPPSATDRGTRVGEAVFYPDDAVNPISIRGEISDRAGNPAASQITIQPDRGSAAPGVTRPHPDLTAAATSRTTGPVATSVAQVTAPPAAKSSAPPPAVADVKPNTASVATGTGTSGSMWPTPIASPYSPQTVAPQTSDYVARRESADVRGPDLFPAVPSGTSPPVRNQYSPALDAKPPVLPPGEKPWMVNRNTFELEYDTESVGPSGIAKVEMWGTRDGGRTWSTYGEDADRRSPIQVTVPGEGTYGFRIVVQNKYGQGGTPPRSGDLPEIWVEVDSTKPQAAIKNIEMGAGEHAGQLAISWEARDSHLAERPITLAFSDRPGSGWSTIVASTENTGIYYWRLDGRLPERVYLRLEVRDEAGNVTAMESRDPVSLTRDAPKARLRGVKPAG